MPAARPSTISPESTLPLKLVISIGAGLLLAGSWATAIHYQLQGLTARLDLIYDTVRELDDGRVRRSSMLYWVNELEAHNPDLRVPDFPLINGD